MSQGKTFAKLLGTESIFMLFAILIAIVSSMIQFLFKKFIGEDSSFFFLENYYRYNYIMYALGMLIFFVATFLIYKKLEKGFAHIAEISTPLKILAWAVLLIWGIVMFILEITMIFLFVTGLTDNIQPEALLYLTVIGWPTVTVLFIGIQYIRKSRSVAK